MKLMSRLFICTVACILAFAGFTLGGLEYGKLDEDQRVSVHQSDSVDPREVERGRQLDAQLAIMHQVLEQKRAIIRDLLGSRIALANAGNRFLALERQIPGNRPKVLRTFFPGQSDMERCCRQVITMALNEAGWDKTAEARLRARLEGDLEVLFGTVSQTD
jgi:hypothetical protein